MIVAPPFEAGADQVTTTLRSEATTDTIVGAPGMSAGVTGLVGEDEEEVPSTFDAVTVKT